MTGKLLKRGDWLRSSLLYFLEIHDKGATSAELAVYTDIVQHQVNEQLGNLERMGKVYSTPYDRNAKLWHIKTQQRLTPATTAVRHQSVAQRRR